MTNDELERALIEFVATELLDGDGGDLDAQTPLLAIGIIDSLSIVSLIQFLEVTCRITIPPDQVRPERFQDIATMAALAAELSLSSMAS